MAPILSRQPAEQPTPRLLAQAMAALEAMMAHRMRHQAYGEVTVSFLWKNGEVTEARVKEETILRPEK